MEKRTAEKRRPTDWDTLMRLMDTAPPLPEQLSQQPEQKAS